MKEQWEQECTDLRAKLAALQQQVQALVVQQASANVSVRTLARWRVSKSMRLVLLPFFMLLVAGGVLYGQGVIDALFIDKDGKVGIGTSTPTAALDVGGKANTDKQISLQLRSGNNSDHSESNQVTFGWSGSDTYRHAIKTRHLSGQQAGNAIDFYVWKYDKDNVDPTAIGGLQTMTLDGGNVGIGTTDIGANKLKVQGDTYLDGKLTATKETELKGNLTAAGNVGIGAAIPNSKLDVRGKALVQSLSFTDENGQSYTDNWIGMANNLGDGNKWLHIGGITDQGKRRMALYADPTYISGNVGIGTTDPKAKLDVDGFILGHNPLDREFRDNEAPGGQSDSARAKAILAGKPDGTFMLAGPNKNHLGYFMFYWKTGGKYYRAWLQGENF